MAYTWKGMKKLGFQEVLRLFEKGMLGNQYFFLYDDTESMMEPTVTLDELFAHYKYGGEFGIEVV